ncbi:hypothetical protein K469DRAFT_705580 [Zopfia rhizophila CBS 207.26]|uniref:GPI anchored cell wall protein n=1 Tax=Zopfia rhizophila CBS 207.26 TaxID=1314779 RepID=A0A6A6E8Z2_9PEZI|nr:hypothetical protein K469DRAFT_705580 [Zopfia rhizophila CBS 207.26]
MMTLTTIVALLTLANAATVTLHTTPCLQEIELETFTIEVDKLVVKDLPTVCGIEILSASGVDVNSLTCLAYKDAEGTDIGSAPFTFKTPAAISTNPVQEGSIRCNSTGEAPRSQVPPAGNSTVASTLATAASTGGVSPTGNTTVPSVTGGPRPSGGATATGGNDSPVPTGGAGAVGMSIGAFAAAFAAFLL